MVGKIKHVRQKLHQEAVKFDEPIEPRGSSLQKNPTSELLTASLRLLNKSSNDASKHDRQAPAVTFFPSRIFAGTKISPEALVQTLKFEEPPNVPTPLTKEISSIKQAKEQQAAEARRKATPVVGDMRPLADALPELSQLISPASTAPSTCRKSRKSKVPVKRPEPTDFSQMKQSQKRKLLETEISSFSSAVKTLSAKTSPLADIGELLRKRMRQEEEQGSI
ncbi:ribosome biogenesis protein SLX9 homolog isoform X2 [Archocentrus centrarchus]|uniref:ribosome biogenesis protein SLX9 homolog isoform X2 n=1 Tax=Archocentrus centrarchus TaxID=63155 RepID=UPI0011E9FF93|nr:protein FAM207A isoform X2 [Archocentrus centrarchus]